MSTIGFGIVGLGRIGWLHADHLKNAISGARLVAAAVDPVMRRDLEEKGTAPCPLVEDVEALLAHPEVEAVVVASPSTLHRDHILIAAQARKAIFAEKPVADSVTAAREVAAGVMRAGVPFQIGFQRRYDAGNARAKQLIDAGAIGTPEMFRGISGNTIAPVSFLKTSGGLFYDLSIHDFDVARFLMGDEIVAVNAVGSVLVEPELVTFDDIDYGIVLLKFAKGGLGVVQSSWRAPAGYEYIAEVHGSLGKVIAEVDGASPARLYDGRGLVVSRNLNFQDRRFGEAYREELQAFVDALLAGRTPTPGMDDAVRAVEISDAATRSRREQRWIELEPAAGEPAAAPA